MQKVDENQHLKAIVRAMINKQLIAVTKKLLAKNLGNKNYKEKATGFIEQNIKSLDGHQRMILEAYCRGDKDINLLTSISNKI